MCRFVFYTGPTISLASLLTEPEHSLINQSVHARERDEPLNGDGFGVSWFDFSVRPEPVVFKEVSPAWNSLNLLNLAPVTRSACILAHVRAASPGLAVTQLNCHPFARGHFAFMHNGEVAGFRQTRRALLQRLSDDQFSQVQSTGDSEVVLALAIDALERRGPAATLEAMGEALISAITSTEEVAGAAGIEAPGYLNLVLSNGTETAITRYVTPGKRPAQTLYLHEGTGYECRDGVCLMHDDHHADERAVLVASEPLSPSPGWVAVPENTLLLIDRDRRVEQRPIEAVRRLVA